MAVKLKAAEKREKALETKIKSLESKGKGGQQEQPPEQAAPPWANGKSLLEGLLEQKKQLEAIPFSGTEAPAWRTQGIADLDKQIVEARAARDQAKPLSA